MGSQGTGWTPPPEAYRPGYQRHSWVMAKEPSLEAETIVRCSKCDLKAYVVRECIPERPEAKHPITTPTPARDDGEDGGETITCTNPNVITANSFASGGTDPATISSGLEFADHPDLGDRWADPKADILEDVRRINDYFSKAVGIDPPEAPESPPERSEPKTDPEAVKTRTMPLVLDTGVLSAEKAKSYGQKHAVSQDQCMHGRVEAIIRRSSFLTPYRSDEDCVHICDDCGKAWSDMSAWGREVARTFDAKHLFRYAKEDAAEMVNWKNRESLLRCAPTYTDAEKSEREALRSSGRCDHAKVDRTHENPGLKGVECRKCGARWESIEAYGEDDYKRWEKRDEQRRANRNRERQEKQENCEHISITTDYSTRTISGHHPRHCRDCGKNWGDYASLEADRKKVRERIAAKRKSCLHEETAKVRENNDWIRCKACGQEWATVEAYRKTICKHEDVAITRDTDDEGNTIAECWDCDARIPIHELGPVRKATFPGGGTVTTLTKGPAPSSDPPTIDRLGAYLFKAPNDLNTRTLLAFVETDDPDSLCVNDATARHCLLTQDKGAKWWGPINTPPGW